MKANSLVKLFETLNQKIDTIHEQIENPNNKNWEVIALEQERIIDFQKNELQELQDCINELENLQENVDIIELQKENESLKIRNKDLDDNLYSYETSFETQKNTIKDLQNRNDFLEERIQEDRRLITKEQNFNSLLLTELTKYDNERQSVKARNLSKEATRLFGERKELTEEELRPRRTRIVPQDDVQEIENTYQRPVRSVTRTVKYDFDVVA